jgi:hypothetical protein
MKTISIYRLAKTAGVQPQSLYTQAKLGALPARKTTCDHCGHTAWTVTESDAAAYLKKRADRQAAQA